MLTARSDGFKCRPFVLLKRVKPDKEVVKKFKSKLELCWAGTNWMNDECTSDYLQKIIGPSFFGKRLLAWDSFRCHISESTKKKLKQLQIDTAVVPGGCTKFIQVSLILVYLNLLFVFRLLMSIGTHHSKQNFVSRMKIGWCMERSRLLMAETCELHQWTFICNG